MQLTAIEGSSAVKAIGFEAGTIRVLWHGGRYNDYEGRTESDFSDFLAAPSKGRFVRDRLASGGCAAPAGETAALDTYEPDDCCGKRLGKAIASGALAKADVWTCPKCGVEWVAELGVPPLGRHWHPQAWAAVFR